MATIVHAVVKHSGLRFMLYVLLQSLLSTLHTQYWNVMLVRRNENSTEI